MDFIEICRFCLSNAKTASNGEDSDHEMKIDDSVKELLKVIFHIDLNEAPNLPQLICKLCQIKLNETHNFYRTIIDSQKTLESKLVRDDIQVSVPCDTDSKSSSKVKVSRFDKKQQKSKQKEEDQLIKEFYGLICKICEETPSFERLHELREHMRSIHAIKETTLECCSKIFKKRGQLLDHVKIHVNPQELTCHECGKQCQNRYRLKVHIVQQHASDDAKTHHCPQCDKKFLTTFNLKSHMKVHLSQEEKDAMKTHICELCKSAYRSKSLLAHHIRQIHQKLYACICDICAKTFNTKKDFISHYKHVHTTPDHVKVQCQVCGKWAANESALKKHVRLIHADPGPHICKLCNKEAPTKNALISHERYMHKSVDKFKCDFCQKCFKKPIHLREHVTKHIGGVLYKCEFCDKTFNSSANYFKHRKYKHVEEFSKLKSETNKATP